MKTEYLLGKMLSESLLVKLFLFSQENKGTFLFLLVIKRPGLKADI